MPHLESRYRRRLPAGGSVHLLGAGIPSAPSGGWLASLHCSQDALTGKIKYKIEKVEYQKELAEQARHKKMVQWAEKKYLDIKEESNLTFSQLVEWCLGPPVVRQNKTVKDIERACLDLEKVFGPILVREIKPGMVEEYQRQRLLEPTWHDKPRSPANINRTITVMQGMFNLAVRKELADKNPAGRVKLLPEASARDRILSPEELDRLLQHLPRLRLGDPFCLPDRDAGE
jgi:hypothetical protein